MPTTSPLRLNSGPPELPGFTATSVWMKPTRSSPGMERPVALTMPAVTLFSNVNGEPIARTHSPGRSFEGSPILTKASVVVRLIGIAAPAGPAFGGKAQCFAEDALKALQRLTPIGSRVWVIADAQLRDPAEHYLLYMWNSAGTFVNLALADGGYVRPDTVKPNIARRGAIEEAVAAAMRAHRGLWGHCAPK